MLISRLSHVKLVAVLIRSLSQLNFRNLQTPRLEFSEGITAIVGHNAAGKSNVLDAIYLGCTGELPGGKIIESVRLGETQGFVGVKVERQDGLSTVEVGLAPGRKSIRLDGQTVRSLDVARVSTAVLITPQDTELIHGSPTGRRAYLDTLLSKLSLRYGLVLREYQRVLEQRNAVLKHNPDDVTLEVWSSKFLELGQEIESLRQRLMLRLKDIARSSYSDIAADGKVLSIELDSSDKASLAERLKLSRAEECARGTTVVGPHREDIRLLLSRNSVQAYGSRGEARTTALALRIAEYQLLQEKHQEAPVLLLDDFSAELDQQRRTYLLELASRSPQVIVSGTESPPEYQMRYGVAGGHLRVT